MKQIFLYLTLSLLSQLGFVTDAPRIEGMTGILSVTCNVGAFQPVSDNLTEVASKESAAAVPTVHNQRLDDLYRKYVSNEDEENQINTIVDALYDTYGTFLASAVIQHNLDREQLFTLLDEDTRTLSRFYPELVERFRRIDPEFYKSVKPNARRLVCWLEVEYSPKLLEFLFFDNMPTAHEVLERLDYIANHIVNFTEDDVLTYNQSLEHFKERYTRNRADTESLSELISYKMFLIDKIMLKVALKNYKFLNRDYYFTNYTGIEGYFGVWMDSVSPETLVVPR